MAKEAQIIKVCAFFCKFVFYTNVSTI